MYNEHKYIKNQNKKVVYRWILPSAFYPGSVQFLWNVGVFIRQNQTEVNCFDF